MMKNLSNVFPAIFILAAGLFFFNLSVEADSELLTFEKDRIKVQTTDGVDIYFDVELALTRGQQKQGLMFRQEMADDAGMLFVFDDVDQRTFWMKNTYIPLDILFLGIDGEIHHIHHSARPQSETLITSKRDSKAVLEINGGLSHKYGIAEGMKVMHPVFNNVHE